MGRDMAERMGEGPCHLGVGMSTRSRTNKMPDKDDNHFNYSYNLTVEDSRFQTAALKRNVLWEDEEDFLVTALRVNASRRQKHPRIQGFVEETVPLYSLSDFKRCFRMSRGTFEVVLGELANRCEVPQELDRGGRKPISVEKHLLLTLWFLGNQEPFHSVADRFNVSESCAFNCLRRVCQALKNMAGTVIVWPKGERARDVVSGFKAKRGIPGVIGAIDGSHIPIKAPTSCPENYINRKGFHSVVLQAVSDHEMMFTDCYVGWPGSVHDARVLNNSSLKSVAEKFEDDSFLLGDSAYPSKTWLMTPCKDYGNLTAQKKHYNFLQSSTRMVVEKSFASLKGRFRKLKYMDMDIRHIPETVIEGLSARNALCVLAKLKNCHKQLQISHASSFMCA
ncbi:hypothetical protein ACROYT_G015308 [Oculina patagonica]